MAKGTKRKNAARNGRGRNTTGQPSTRKTGEDKPSPYIFPHLLAYEHDVHKNLHPTGETAGGPLLLDESRCQIIPSGDIENSVPIAPEVGQTRIDDDGQSSDDIDDLTSIDSDDLENLLGGDEEPSPGCDFPGSARNINQILSESSIKYDTGPRSSFGRRSINEEDASPRRGRKSTSSGKEVSVEADVPTTNNPPSPYSAPEPVSENGADYTTVQEHVRKGESSLMSDIQVHDPEKPNELENSPDVSTSPSWFPSTSVAAPSEPLPVNREESISILSKPPLLAAEIEKRNSEQLEQGEGLHTTQSASVLARAPEIPKAQPTCKRKATVFEEQYEIYKRPPSPR